jgi:hypothetical protein
MGNLFDGYRQITRTCTIGTIYRPWRAPQGPGCAAGHVGYVEAAAAQPRLVAFAMDFCIKRRNIRSTPEGSFMTAAFLSHIDSELEGLKSAGLYKSERVITSMQSAEIEVAGGKKVLNFCANKSWPGRR